MVIKLSDLINLKNFSIESKKNLCAVPTLHCNCEFKNRYNYSVIPVDSNKDYINSDLYTSLINNIKPNKKHTRRLKKKSRSTKKLK